MRLLKVGVLQVYLARKESLRENPFVLFCTTAERKSFQTVLKGNKKIACQNVYWFGHDKSFIKSYGDLSS